MRQILNTKIDLYKYFTELNSYLGFFQLFNKKKSNIIAFDIGSSGIKICELGKSDRQIKLINFDIVPIEEKCVNNHHIDNKDLLLEKLQNIIAKHGYNNRDAALILSGPQIITQIIQAPLGLDDNQLLTHIEIEAEKYMPFNTEEIAWDYDILGNNKQKKELSDVMLVATKKGYVDEYINLFANTNIKLKVIDVYNCVVGRLSKHSVGLQLNKNITDKVIAMVDVGHDFTSLSVFQNERLLYSKEQNFGSQLLSKAIQEEHELSSEQAMKLKSNHSDPAIAKLIAKYNEQFANQIFHMLQFLYSSTNTKNIDHLFLFGGGSTLRGLDETLADKLNQEVLYLDPFSDINVSAFVNNKKFIDNKSSLAVVCGLALRSYVE